MMHAFSQTGGASVGIEARPCLGQEVQYCLLRLLPCPKAASERFGGPWLEVFWLLLSGSFLSCIVYLCDGPPQVSLASWAEVSIQSAFFGFFCPWPCSE